MTESALRILPEALRIVSGDLGRLSGDVRQIQQSLKRSWRCLDEGWDWCGEAGITNHFHESLNAISYMSVVLLQMGEALYKIADLIEDADQVAVALFTELEAISQAQPDQAAVTVFNNMATMHTDTL